MQDPRRLVWVSSVKTVRRARPPASDVSPEHQQNYSRYFTSATLLDQIIHTSIIIKDIDLKLCTKFHVCIANTEFEDRVPAWDLAERYRILTFRSLSGERIELKT
ncbi:hypothetical protein J6590_010769 [Homalodisca vitripennis]|nr:hypothetical protein J6590_010769 [Homalodisca vitripennis]